MMHGAYGAEPFWQCKEKKRFIQLTFSYTCCFHVSISLTGSTMITSDLHFHFCYLVQRLSCKVPIFTVRSRMCMFMFLLEMKNGRIHVFRFCRTVRKCSSDTVLMKPLKPIMIMHFHVGGVGSTPPGRHPKGQVSAQQVSFRNQECRIGRKSAHVGQIMNRLK